MLNSSSISQVDEYHTQMKELQEEKLFNLAKVSLNAEEVIQGNIVSDSDSISSDAEEVVHGGLLFDNIFGLRTLKFNTDELGKSNLSVIFDSTNDVFPDTEVTCYDVVMKDITLISIPFITAVGILF